MMPLDLHLTCVYCGKWCDDSYTEVAPLITAHPSCAHAKKAACAQEHANKPRPIHVSWWRCGAAGLGRGWTRCTTADPCKNHGCQKLEIKRLAEGRET